jgi:hypothetical protein
VPTSSTTPGAPETEGVIISSSTIPAGTTAEERSWCQRAKPVTERLVNLYSLDVAQLEALVNEARALQPSAPASLQPALAVLGDIGGRFLAAVKAGQTSITPEGVTTWANRNLTREQQVGFLTAGGDIVSYISRTC